MRYFAQFRTKKDARKFKQVNPEAATPVKAPPRRPPTASHVAHWITFKEDQRLEWQQKYLLQLCQADPQIQLAYDLITEFTTMLRERAGERLDAWLQKAEEQGITELKSFAQSPKKDYDAVKAGLTLIWSQGPVEGHVHRLKLLKRQAYGRASFHTNVRSNSYDYSALACISCHAKMSTRTHIGITLFCQIGKRL